jgi:putative membrane protein
MNTIEMKECRRPIGMGMHGLMLVPMAALGFLLVKAVRHHHKNRPLEVLKTRYAKGEINREEYERIKNELSC